MDAIVKKETRFLPALADAIAEWFPELDGRAIAVSEVSITVANVPRLPLAMVAFVRADANPPARSHNEQFDITDTFIVEFWLEPVRYKRQNGTETPFWSYYDYEAVRDTLLGNIVRWETPGGQRISFRSLTIDAEPEAVTLTFGFNAVYRWCAPVTEFGEPIKSVGVNLCTPVPCCPDACLEEKPDDCDPCP